MDLLWSECLLLRIPLPPNSCQNTNAQCNGIKRQGLWRCLGHEGEVLMNGLSALIKETLQSSLALSAT